jgi:hypothetical protein
MHAIGRMGRRGSLRKTALHGVLNMSTRRSWWALAVLVAVLWSAGPVQADITSIAGSVSAVVREFVSDQAGRTDQESAEFPDPVPTLPLQVVAELRADGQEQAAAAAAAQFADPFQLTTENPEEFAIDLALLSVSPRIRYTADARSQETRGVVFTTTEFPLRSPGQTLGFTGRLFIDGALAVFSPTVQRDLTGANVSLLVTVVTQSAGRADETVFSGRVGLQGGTSGSVQNIAEGDFPTRALIRSDLTSVVTEFEVFEVLIIPSITIDYRYTAAINEPFSLVATVEVEAANASDEVGVIALVGTPVDSIQQVIAALRGETLASKMTTALVNERAQPTGTPAFPTTGRAMPMCGMLGFEFVLGLGALVGLRWRRPLRRALLTE